MHKNQIVSAIVSDIDIAFPTDGTKVIRVTVIHNPLVVFTKRLFVDFLLRESR